MQPPQRVTSTATVASLLTALLASCSSSPGPCESEVAGTLCAIAGTNELAFIKDGLPAQDTAFYLPSEMRRGPDGLLYIMDYNNMRLRRIEADGTVKTIAGDGFHAGATEGIPATESSLENPIDFAFLPDGRPILLSYHDPRVLVIDTDGTFQKIAGNSQPGIRGYEGDGGDANLAQFFQLAGIAVGPDGAIYLSDDSANRVRVIREGVITTFAGAGSPTYTGDGGAATAATLFGPTALAIDAANTVYIADAGNHAIRKVTSDGTITTIAGIGTKGFSGDGGPATSAQLAAPDGVAVADDGTVFISDRLNSVIRKIALDGTITTIVGNGVRGYKGDNGPALAAELGYPSRIQLDTDGRLLIADQTNSCVRALIAPR